MADRMGCGMMGHPNYCTAWAAEHRAAVRRRRRQNLITFAQVVIAVSAFSGALALVEWFA